MPTTGGTMQPFGVRAIAGKLSVRSGTEVLLTAVLCVGQLVADIVARPVDSLPHPGRTDLVESLQLIAGGSAANTAGVLAKFGVDASVAGLVGKDALGDAVLADLVALGVNVTRVLRSSDVPTSAVIVVVDSSGERSFIYRIGGNERLSNEHIADSAFDEAEWAQVGGAMKLVRLDLGSLMCRAKRAGCVTSLDTDWDASGQWLSRLDGALEHVDYLMTNEEEGSMLAGVEDPLEAGGFLLARGPRAVIIKRGRSGCTLVMGTGCVDYPTHPVDVVDTTCAGDSFAAGFICGISRGPGIEGAVRLANAAGALISSPPQFFFAYAS